MNQSDYLIIANGNFLKKEMLQKLLQDKIILALDGAADRLKDLSILPNIILGDFDSIKNLSEWKQNQSIQIIHAPDQNKTDLFKAIEYIDQLEAKSIHLVCGLSSSRVDHMLNNLRALRVFYQKNRPIYFYTDEQKIFFAKDELIRFSGKVGDIVGIMSFPKAEFTSEGLKYNGQHFPLNFGFSESVANTFAENKAIIAIKGEALIIQTIN